MTSHAKIHDVLLVVMFLICLKKGVIDMVRTMGNIEESSNYSHVLVN